MSLMARKNVKTVFKTLKSATYSDCGLEPVAIATPNMSKLLHKDNGSYWEFSQSTEYQKTGLQIMSRNGSVPWCVHFKTEKSEKANGLFSESGAVSIRKLSYGQCSLSHALLCSFFTSNSSSDIGLRQHCVPDYVLKKKHQFLCIHAKFYFQIFPTAHKFLVPTLAELL